MGHGMAWIKGGFFSPTTCASRRGCGNACVFTKESKSFRENVSPHASGVKRLPFQPRYSCPGPRGEKSPEFAFWWWERLWFWATYVCRSNNAHHQGFYISQPSIVANPLSQTPHLLCEVRKKKPSFHHPALINNKSSARGGGQRTNAPGGLFGCHFRILQHRAALARAKNDVSALSCTALCVEIITR